MNMENIGAFPADGEQARIDGTFYKITGADMLCSVFGRDNPLLMKFFVSNDVAQFGVLKLPSGGIGPRYSEPFSHSGDALLYALEDGLTVHVPSTGDVFMAERDEAVFIPAATEYRCINYTGAPVSAVFAICPRL